MPGLSARLADSAAVMELRRVPGEVVSETKLRVLDMLGAMLAGSGNALATKARGAAAAEESGGSAMIIGFGDRASVETASLVNGILAHVLEFDDTHGSPVLAAILSAAEQRRLPTPRSIPAATTSSPSSTPPRRCCASVSG
jgi:2-methylcitrate dehydratase PrpD